MSKRRVEPLHDLKMRESRCKNYTQSTASGGKDNHQALLELPSYAIRTQGTNDGAQNDADSQAVVEFGRDDDITVLTLTRLAIGSNNCPVHPSHLDPGAVPLVHGDAISSLEHGA
ncbi:MAG TPA: hypothetical protein VKR52_21150 [Terracidiphilus sp.]|nr:hypothetical protein [Terracidiphilus sp.]